VAIPDEDVTVNLGAGRAEMKVENLPLDDYFTKANAFGANFETADVPATASFDVVWSSPVTRRLDFQDTTHIDQFGGEYVEDQVSVTWSASNANGFSFTANPGTFSTSFNAFAELAHEQNGTFFRSDRDSAAALVQASRARTAQGGTLVAPSVAAPLAVSGTPQPDVVEAQPPKNGVPSHPMPRMTALTGAAQDEAPDWTAASTAFFTEIRTPR
jgi:hypothetical protein